MIYVAPVAGRAAGRGDPTFRVGDLWRRAAALYGCCAVYHLAVRCGGRSPGDPIGNHAVTAPGTLTVLEAAGRYGASRFVHCSPRPGGVHVLKADTARAKRQLGTEAFIALEGGVGRYLAWFTARLPDPAALLEQGTINWDMPR